MTEEVGVARVEATFAFEEEGVLFLIGDALGVALAAVRTAEDEVDVVDAEGGFGFGVVTDGLKGVVEAFEATGFGAGGFGPAAATAEVEVGLFAVPAAAAFAFVDAAVTVAFAETFVAFEVTPTGLVVAEVTAFEAVPFTDEGEALEAPTPPAVPAFFILCRFQNFRIGILRDFSINGPSSPSSTTWTRYPKLKLRDTVADTTMVGFACSCTSELVTWQIRILYT